MSSYYYCYRD